ncbi:hypothetical protein [Actinokineospora bangkokensis]|nr:hypothetical protein [Actinokineospora bangkokensis]
MDEEVREWWEGWETRFADIDVHGATGGPTEVIDYVGCVAA